jgi:hypothetical protein
LALRVNDNAAVLNLDDLRQGGALEKVDWLEEEHLAVRIADLEVVDP